MEKQKILDHLYTARWCLNQDPAKSTAAMTEVTAIINALTGQEGVEIIEDEETDIKDKGTKADGEVTKATLVVIVGHEKKAPGADFALGGSEYEYNSDIARRMKEYALTKYPYLAVEIVLRDGIGIGGAYRKAATFKPDACIELHFNAFNKIAQGSETLCSVDYEDRKLAGIIQTKICAVFERGGQSRGVKVLARNDRGGQSVYSLPGSANCLPEAFFGDNPNEAKMANEKRVAYSAALLDGVVEWLKGNSIA